MFKAIALRCARVLAATALAACSLPALAAVPGVELSVLVALYINNNGAGWTHNTHWGDGDPCDNAWFGIVCNPGKTAITEINLPSNNLVGVPGGVGGLPANLNALTQLKTVSLYDNDIVGVIPSLTGLVNLVNFSVGGNRLSGSIPALSGLTSLEYFVADENELTGSIPALTNLPALRRLYVGENRLTGPIPSLTGAPALTTFSAPLNELTGTIPPLAGSALTLFSVNSNQLSGPIPTLPNSLEEFYVNGNNLSGTMPPAPPALIVNRSQVCLPAVAGRANNPGLTLSADPATNVAWNTATGEADWNAGCRAALAAVPTLGEWALMAMGLVLAGLGASNLRRRDTPSN